MSTVTLALPSQMRGLKHVYPRPAVLLTLVTCHHSEDKAVLLILASHGVLKQRHKIQCPNLPYNRWMHIDQFI